MCFLNLPLNANSVKIEVQVKSDKQVCDEYLQIAHLCLRFVDLGSVRCSTE